MSDVSNQYIERESNQAIAFSANRYASVNLSTDYVPKDYFRALHINIAGDLVITGIDDVEVTISVEAGLWPFGGKKIDSTSTVAGVTALF